MKNIYLVWFFWLLSEPIFMKCLAHGNLIKIAAAAAATVGLQGHIQFR